MLGVSAPLLRCSHNVLLPFPPNQVWQAAASPVNTTLPPCIPSLAAGSSSPPLTLLFLIHTAEMTQPPSLPRVGKKSASSKATRPSSTSSIISMARSSRPSWPNTQACSPRLMATHTRLCRSSICGVKTASFVLKQAEQCSTREQPLVRSCTTSDEKRSKLCPLAGRRTCPNRRATSGSSMSCQALQMRSVRTKIASRC